MDMGEAHRIMDIVLQGVPEENVKFLENPDDIFNVCRENLRGTSNCYGAIQWNSIDLEKKVYNYTVRGNSGLSYVNVGGSQSSADVYVLPLQFAVDKAIANITVTPQSLPFTMDTEEDYKNKMNKIYMKTIINWLAPALFLCMIGVIYHLAGVVAQEREIGMTNLMTSMGLGRGVRFISYHLSFSVVYLIGWIVIAIVFCGLLYRKTNAAIIIFYHIFSGLSMVSWAMFLGNFFKSAQLAGIFASGLSVLLAIMTTLQTRINAAEGPYQTGAIYALSFLFPPCNYCYFISTISRFQKVLLGTNLVETAPDSNIKVIVIFIFAIVQIFLFLFLAVASDRVFLSFKKPKTASEGELNDPAAAVQITNLNKTYKSRKIWPRFKKSTFVAVDDLSVGINAGQIVSLLGANGSGKTTTLEMISGIQPVTSGSILLRPGSKVGICPQKNVLWDNLTVREHVEVWAGIKGAKGSKEELKALVDDLIERCDLTSKATTRAVNLSGGQQRKLQLAIMFVGGSSVLLVDEATSGMDPLSRRKIWDILLECRGSLTLILTTHFLDEAETLSDNLLIMSRGVLKAEGPTLRLKNRLGGGYHIITNSSSSGSANEKTNTIVTDEEEIIEVESTDAVLKTITSLQENGRQYRVEGPSLESVFLNIAQSDHEGFKLTASGAEWIEDSDTEANTLDAAQIAETLQVTSKGTVGLYRQIIAMFTKRVIIFRRTPLAELVVFFLPIIVAVATRTFLVNFNGSGCSITEQFESQEFTDLDFQSFSMVAGPSFANTAGFLNVAGNYRASLGLTNVTSNQILGMLLQETTLVDNFTAFTNIVNQNFATLVPGGFYLGDSNTPPTIAYIIDLPDFGTYTGTTLLNILDNALINGTVNIATNYSPFQNTWSSSTGDSLQFVVYFGLAMSVAPAFISLYPTFERLSKVRAMHYSNGLRIFPLWFAHTSFNFIIFVLLSAILTAIVGTANSTIAGIGYLFLCFLLYGLSSILVSFVMSLIVKSQLAAFAMTAALQAVYFLVYLIAYLSILAYGSPTTISSNLLIVHFVMALFMPVANLVRALFVSLNLFGVICHEDGSGRISYLGDIIAYGGPILYMILQIIVLFLGILWWESGKYRLSFNFRKRENAAILQSDVVLHDENSDISKETDLVDNSPDLFESGLRLSHVHKIFDGGNNHVVNDVSIGIRKGECFALLGPNGAGKTTTFNMIRGEIPPTSGEIFVNGISVLKDRSAARTRLGVCPQFDAMDKMTVVEILHFYGKLRGLDRVDYHVDKIIEAVGIGKFRDRMAYKLSGGNKRKLSLAVALVGNPPVLLLDEMSTSMDIAAKRIMWRTLSLISHGRSIILTTHSMEEAQALASRAGFLAKRLLAVGTSDDLREKYGQVNHLHVICNNAPNTTMEEMNAIVEWVEEQFPGSGVEDKLNQGQIRMSIPFQKENDLLPVYRSLEEHKTQLGIESYSLTPTSLEEVFLRIIGKHQVTEEGYMNDIV